MTFSGENACRGSTKEDRILPHFLHSAAMGVSQLRDMGGRRRRQAWGGQSARGRVGLNVHAIDDGRGLLRPMAVRWVGVTVENAGKTGANLGC